MPVRVGTDLVAVDTVRASLAAHGDRYLARVFTQPEVADCRTSDGVDAERLAARFAAKEAAMKVLRPGDEGIPWREIEVRRDPAGWVELELRGRAAALATEGRLEGFSVSLTHEAGLAFATVTAEVRPFGR